MQNDLYRNELINIILNTDLYLESIEDIRIEKYYNALYDGIISFICIIVLIFMLYYICFIQKKTIEPINNIEHTKVEPIHDVITHIITLPTKKPDHNDNIKSFNEYDTNNGLF